MPSKNLLTFSINHPLKYKAGKVYLTFPAL
jgi:hypothetical protein